MKDETIEDQNELIELIEEAGYEVSSVEIVESEYKTHEEHKVTDVSIEIRIGKKYEQGFESPYRVK